jgi:hypothetical protein
MFSRAVFVTFFAVLGLTGCSTSESMKEQLIGQGCTVGQPDPRACDPADTQKTTICHIPPGNPANAHTICVGNAAVPAHVNNHGDFIGTCVCTDDGGVTPPDDGGTTSGSDDGGTTVPPGDAGTGSGSDDGGVVL